MAYEIHTWLIEGISPLMQSNPEKFIESSEKDDKKAKKLSAKKKTYNDEEEADNRSYRDNGNFVHPASAFRRGLCAAVAGRKYGPKSARMVIAGAVFPVEEAIVILDQKQKPASKYTIDRRSVVIKSRGARNKILRCRPKFEKWSMKLALEIDTDLIEEDQVTQALVLMGRTIGLGENRPDPSDGKSGIGTCGRFTAKLVK